MREGTGRTGNGQRRSATARAARQPAPGRQLTPLVADITDLSYGDARLALQESVARLQASDLDIEQLSATYARAMALARHCEQVLEQVEQEVLQIDPDALADGDAAQPLTTQGNTG